MTFVCDLLLIEASAVSSLKPLLFPHTALLSALCIKSTWDLLEACSVFVEKTASKRM